MPTKSRNPRQCAASPVRLGLVVLSASLLLAPIAHAAGGSSAGVPTTPEVEESPEQNATRHYNMGLKARDKAWELEEKAAAESGEKAEKLARKAQKEYERAIKYQRNAVTANPRMHQAYSSLGYALRKTGEFDESIKAYDKALSLSPGYTEAIEYRAEAYLALNRLEEAKEAYLILIRNDQARADELMTAMKKWLAETDGRSEAVSTAELEAFASWVEERADVAGLAAMLASTSTRDW